MDEHLRRIRPDAPAAPPGMPAVDVAIVLEATGDALLRAFARHRVAGGPGRAQALQALMRALELRCRLERELLLPALRSAWHGKSRLLEDTEVDQLQMLAARLAPQADAYEERQTALTTLLEASVRQRLEQVATIVEFTRRDARLDGLGLGRALMIAIDDWHAYPDAI